MTPKKKSSLDNGADTHIHSESVTVRSNQTKPQAGEREPSPRCTRSHSYQEAFYHWYSLEKWKRYFSQQNVTDYLYILETHPQACLVFSIVAKLCSNIEICLTLMRTDF